MFLSAAFGFFGGGGGVAVPLPGGTASGDVPGNASLTAGWRFNSDGTVDRRDDNGWHLAVHAWYSPTTPGIGASYQLRATQLSGGPFDVGTFDTWLAISSARTFTDTVVASSNLADVLMEISTDGSDATVVTDGTYGIDILSEP